MRRPTQVAALLLLLCASALRAAEAPPPDPALRAAVDGDARNPRLLPRDAARHPLEVLSFLGIRPDMTVVEMWPAGGYWSEILAPYLDRGGGTYIAALESEPADNPDHEAAEKRDSYFAHRVADDPSLFAGAKLSAFGPDHETLAAPDSVDMILSFRDLHQWMKQGFAQEALVACYTALKPGGVLALEDHRGNRPPGEQDPRASDGYVHEDYARGLAQLAGFEFVDASEIGANPKDTANWPHGVTTLGPTFALGAQDRAKYEAVGEPDDFLLKFRKPR